MKKIESTELLRLYTGSTFSAGIFIRDFKGRRFMISEGDEIDLYIKPVDKSKTKGYQKITLTSEDEICGKYLFHLTPEVTAKMSGDYYCEAFIRFQDGDYYQITPRIPVKAAVPYEMPVYPEPWQTIEASVPRSMRFNGYIPGILLLQDAISQMEAPDNSKLIRIRRIAPADVIIVGDCIDTNTVTPAGLVDTIRAVVETSEHEEVFIAGFFHADELPWQQEYLAAVKTAFEERFIDVEYQLKRIVFDTNNNNIVASGAVDMLMIPPTEQDLLHILHNEYMDCMMEDATHFSDKGCYAAARMLLKQIGRIIANIADNTNTDENE